MNDPYQPDESDAERQLLDQYRRRRRPDRRPKSSAELLSRLIASRGFTQEMFNEDLQRAWESAVGNRFVTRTMVTGIRQGALEILVDSSPAMQQLGFQKRELLRKIQQTLPDAGIRSLRFRVGNLPR